MPRNHICVGRNNMLQILFCMFPLFLQNTGVAWSGSLPEWKNSERKMQYFLFHERKASYFKRDILFSKIKHAVLKERIRNCHLEMTRMRRTSITNSECLAVKVYRLGPQWKIVLRSENLTICLKKCSKPAPCSSRAGCNDNANEEGWRKELAVPFTFQEICLCTMTQDFSKLFVSNSQQLQFRNCASHIFVYTAGMILQGGRKQLQLSADHCTLSG